MPKPLPASLSQKIAQSQLGTGPSLVPQAHAKQQEPEEVIPTIDELIDEQEDKDTLRSLLNAYRVPHAEIKRLEKVVEPLKGRIKVLISQYGIAKAKCDDDTIIYYPTTRSTVNAKKLLAAGVEQAVIDICTDVTESYTLKIV